MVNPCIFRASIMLEKFNLRSDFFKSVVLLTSGTVLAQAISFLASPVLTRLFTPEESGELGFFLRIVAFISSVATARYELAIPLPKTNSHAFQLFRLSLKIAKVTLISTLIGGVVYWAIDGFDTKLGLYIVAIVIGSYGVIFKNLGSNWAIRTKAFRRISVSNVLGAVGLNGFKIGAGLMGYGVPGLILATVIGFFVSAILFFVDFLNIKGLSENQKNKMKQYALAKEHIEFPKVNLPHVLIDNGRELLLAIFFVEFFNEFVFGSYDHSFRTLKLPLVVVGTAMGQAFYQRCSELYNLKEPLLPFLKRTTRLLALLSILPFGIIFLFGEPIFAFVFSEEWRFAGKISEVLTPWLLINFIASPISTLPLVIKKQGMFFWLGLGNTAIQLLGFGLLPLIIGTSEEESLQVFRLISWSMSVYLLAIVFLKLELARRFDLKYANKSGL